MKLFSFSGAHSTGKTTLLDALESNKSNIQIIRSNVRELVKNGVVKINLNSSISDQLKISTLQYTNIMVKAKEFALLNPKNLIVLTERGPIDALCYTQVLFWDNKITKSEFNTLKDWLITLIKIYDRIYYFKKEFALVDDNFRETDENFHQKTLEAFEKNIPNLNIPTIILTGSVEERLSQFLDSIS